MLQMGPQQGVLQQGATEDKGTNARMVSGAFSTAVLHLAPSHAMPGW
jgi:hypothetical protein